MIFETKEDAVIKAGELSTVVGASEGETFNELIGVSDGTPNQSFYFPRSGIIGIESLSVGDYVWEAVESVADHLPGDKVYAAELDAWSRVRITFGDGLTGQVPRDGERITSVYRVGGGVNGNVAPNTIVNVRDIATDEKGNRVAVSVTNLNWASGGANPESAARIKLYAPRWFETQNRCVTERDYETFAMAYNNTDFGAIAKAKAVVRERTAEANVIRYYVLTYGEQAGALALASQTQKDALLNYLNQYKMLTDWLEIEDGKWREIDIKGEITIISGFSADKVLANVNAALAELMNVETREMGDALRISDVYAAIDNIEGVIHVELNTPKKTINADINELLILGDTSFKISIDGANLNGENI